MRRTVEGDTRDYLLITLTDVAVVKYDLAPAQDRDDVLAEKVGFAYRSINFSYEGQHGVELEVRSTR